ALVQREVVADRERGRREDPRATGIGDLPREHLGDGEWRRVQLPPGLRDVDPTDPGGRTRAGFCDAAEAGAPAREPLDRVGGTLRAVGDVLAALGELRELRRHAIERSG